MALNPSIILAGQQPDLVNTLDRSNLAAARANQMQEKRQMNALYQQYGQGLVAGDQQAINALAAADPARAMDFSQVHRGNRMQDQEIQMKMAEYKRGLSAEQAAAEAEQIKRGVFMASAAKSPEEWDAIMQQLGQDELVGQFGMKDVLLRQYMTAAQILEANEGPKPDYQIVDGQYIDRSNPAAGAQPVPGLAQPGPDWRAATPEEASQYGASAGQINAKTGEFKRTPTDKSMTIESDGKGGFRFVQGAEGQGDSGTPSERQSTLRLFGGLMNETMPALNDMEDDPNFNPVSPRSAAAGSGTIGNLVTTPEAQRYEALKRQWAEGVLRIQTGAAATEPEIRRVMETYFPRLGDDASTVAQKRQQRDIFARSLVPASGGTMPAPGGADRRGGLRESQPIQGEEPRQESNPFIGISDEEFSTIDLNSLSAEELDQLFEARSQ